MHAINGHLKLSPPVGCRRDGGTGLIQTHSVIAGASWILIKLQGMYSARFPVCIGFDILKFVKNVGNLHVSLLVVQAPVLLGGSPLFGGCGVSSCIGQSGRGHTDQVKG